MLRLLLDEHIAPAVARQLRQRAPELEVWPLATWEGGVFLGADDDAILGAAAHAGCTLVTYDLRTVPPLLKCWAERGSDHAGVIFVDCRTLPQRGVGALARALVELWHGQREGEWLNRVVSLACRPARRT